MSRGELSPDAVGLVGDVGGTHARFAAATTDRLLQVHTWPTADLPPLPEVFAHLAPGGRPAAFATVAVAAPVDGLSVRLTNTDTQIDLRTLSTENVRLVNDLEAAAAGIDAVPPTLRRVLRSGTPASHRPAVVVGIGTGLGVAIRLPGGALLPGEGGHAPYAPRTPDGWALSQGLEAALGRPVEWEDLLCGQGYGRVAAWFAGSRPLAVSGTRGELEARAVRGATEAGDAFFAGALGDLLRGLALTVQAGAVFLCGGAAAHLQRTLARPELATRFAAPGPVARVLAGVPVTLLLDDHLALRGCQAISRQTRRDRHRDRA